MSYFQVEALNGTMTSPRTLLCQRQRVTSSAPNLPFRHPSTSPRRRRGARNPAGLTGRPTPGSPSRPPASPASLSRTSQTRTWSREVSRVRSQGRAGCPGAGCSPGAGRQGCSSLYEELTALAVCSGAPAPTSGLRLCPAGPGGPGAALPPFFSFFPLFYQLPTPIPPSLPQRGAALQKAHALKNTWP